MGFNEKDVIQQWYDVVLPRVHEIYESDYVIDVPARSESFNDLVDSLASAGIIEWELAGNICLPDIFEHEFHPML